MLGLDLLLLSSGHLLQLRKSELHTRVPHLHRAERDTRREQGGEREKEGEREVGRGRGKKKE